MEVAVGISGDPKSTTTFKSQVSKTCLDDPAETPGLNDTVYLFFLSPKRCDSIELALL